MLSLNLINHAPTVAIFKMSSKPFLQANLLDFLNVSLITIFEILI